MHIGKFLNSELIKRKITIADLAKEVNKSDTGVRKDLEKEHLHQSVIEAYSRVLGLNIYAVLAKDFSGDYEEVDTESPEYLISKEPVHPYGKRSNPEESISVTFTLPSSKKRQLIKLLTD